VGGVGIANIMVISVLERRQEIGLRRSLGATRGHIRLQFLTESVVLSLLGGVAGVAAGLAITLGYAAWQDWPLVLPGQTLAGACSRRLASARWPGCTRPAGPPGPPPPRRWPPANLDSRTGPVQQECLVGSCGRPPEALV
jgi:hypothetical protein